MTAAQIVAIVVFLGALGLIISEKVNRALVALAGAVLLLALHIVSFDVAMSHVDYNTLGVLLGMMLFVAVVKQSGIFEYLAIRCAHLAKGHPWPIMVLLMVLTACLSAFLDNVTTVLLMGPVTLTLCRLLDLDPVPYFLGEIMASNIGGTSTLIGDPPNIMIGSAAHLSFSDFLLNDGPAAALALIAVLVMFYFLYGRRLRKNDTNADAVMALAPADYIKDRRLLRVSIVLTGLVVIGFVLHDNLGLESCVIALGAAALILLISRTSIEEALGQVEWVTLAFFAGLFVIVGALTETGVIALLAEGLIGLTGGSVFATMLVLLFGSALVSAFLDNIPFVATMIPILLALGASGMDTTPLWWAVSLGACLGGNGSIIGASANVVLSDISAQNGHEITFAQFFRVGFPCMLLTVAVAAVYLMVRFPM
ncbi:ArsB/NhaD family transporter [Adlercreutzia shanghongiae]|uniref:ArsB/NhaD family transporter n=1 Tax=Adlercreutzia shanghongiae TaxID=3111773 RepID=A0ABU6IW57_9ACTN|nr:ArsB/NhaD family transporter [Adlercreutzia sp. R22]MEC4294059.1 ArsB/NhaD family transporter [Adlercreutzia sp. R22]